MTNRSISSRPVVVTSVERAMDGSTARLDRDEFVRRLQESARLFWCIAAAIVGDHARAHDVVQEASLIALGKLHEFDPATSFTAWMSQIVRYTSLNESRKARRERAGENASEVLAFLPSRGHGHSAPVVGSSGALLPDQQSFDDRVARALSGLDPTARACLLLRVVMEMPYNEIAVALDIPEGTAMSHVHRSRKTLRDTLGGARS